MPDQFESLLTDLEAEDRREIATIPVRFTQRALAGDWAGVAALYHPEAIQMPPDQPAVEGRDAIRQALSHTLGAEGGVRLEDFAVSVREAASIGDLVYVRAAYRLKIAMTIDGNEKITLEQSGPYINILCRDGERHWCIWRQIYSRDHPPLVP